MLFVLLASSISFAAPSAPPPNPAYDCTVTVQGKDGFDKNISLPGDKSSAAIEFQKPGLSFKQMARIDRGIDSVGLEIFNFEKSEWKSTSRTTVGGFVRSIMLVEANQSYISCVKK